jgi:hypothetical protein
MFNRLCRWGWLGVQIFVLADSKRGGVGDSGIVTDIGSPFDYLTDYNIQSGAAGGTYSSIYKLLVIISVCGFFITGGWGFIKLMALSRSGEKRNEGKSAVIFKMVVLCLVCLCIGLVSWIKGFWSGIL